MQGEGFEGLKLGLFGHLFLVDDPKWHAHQDFTTEADVEVENASLGDGAV